MTAWRRKEFDMADEFDMVDIVYGAVASATGDLTVYKGPSPTGETKDHITIRTLALHEQTAVNKGPVNINVFIRHKEKGIPNRERMKSVVRRLRDALKNIRAPAGMYWKSRIVWSEPLGEAKGGFDCMNIRLEVITEK